MTALSSAFSLCLPSGQLVACVRMKYHPRTSCLIKWFVPSCVEGGLGQIAKLLVLVRRCACPALLGQVSTTRACGQKSDVKVGVQVQQRRVKHEKGGSETENKDTHATNTFFLNLSHAEDVRMCADKLCNRKMCVQQVSVCTLHGGPCYPVMTKILLGFLQPYWPPRAARHQLH